MGLGAVDVIHINSWDLQPAPNFGFIQVGLLRIQSTRFFFWGLVPSRVMDAPFWGEKIQDHTKRCKEMYIVYIIERNDVEGGHMNTSKPCSRCSSAGKDLNDKWPAYRVTEAEYFDHGLMLFLPSLFSQSFTNDTFQYKINLQKLELTREPLELKVTKATFT